MKNIFDNIWRYIGDIFIEDVQVDLSLEWIHYRDVTGHYRIDFPRIELDAVFIWTKYSDIENIIESYKYRSEREYVRIFVSIFTHILRDQNIEDAVIVTVPMHWTRFSLRGFDHMDYLAKKLSKETGIPYIQPLKTSFSRRQSRLTRKKRLENRRNHFTIDDSIMLPQRIFLIDDVISTWATAHECAKVLKEYGAREVIGVFLASSVQ